MEKKNTPVIVNAVNRHPALQRRDAAYAAAPRHPRLTEDGQLICDPMPLATELIGLRPLTKEEQIRRFTDHGHTDFNLVPDEHFISEDDFHDYLDDLPEEGWSPSELAAMQSEDRMIAIAMENQARVYEAGRGHVPPPEPSDDAGDASPDSATPPPSPVAQRAQNAGGAKGDAPATRANKHITPPLDE